MIQVFTSDVADDFELRNFQNTYLDDCAGEKLQHVIGKCLCQIFSQICFIFTPTWENGPIWLIFFKWNETTN